MITQTDNEFITLKPRDGFWLTNGQIWSKCVYLAINATPEGWRETDQDPPTPPEEAENTTEEQLAEANEALEILTGKEIEAV